MTSTTSCSNDMRRRAIAEPPPCKIAADLRVVTSHAGGHALEHRDAAPVHGIHQQ
jgi:hypothetical protein